MEMNKIQLYGDELFDAQQNARQITPLTDRESQLSIESAYAIQQHTIARRVSGGDAIIGKKIGITAKAVMNLLGVNQPDFGQLLSSFQYGNDDVLKMSDFCQPKGEGEIAFILKKDLKGPGITSAEVLAATDYLLPAFEIVDSRVSDWKIKIQDTVADNASAGAFVLGNTPISPKGIDLSTCGMVLKKNGEIIGTGAGAATMSHPVNAVTWLANKLGELGLPLKAGEIILSGSLSIMFPIQSGDHLSMKISGIGEVTCQFN
jgi:2-oxopent-4-enoate/cis-2-oxohex-4-enoate hydratase